MVNTFRCDSSNFLVLCPFSIGVSSWKKERNCSSRKNSFHKSGRHLEESGNQKELMLFPFVKPAQVTSQYNIIFEQKDWGHLLEQGHLLDQYSKLFLLFFFLWFWFSFFNYYYCYYYFLFFLQDTKIVPYLFGYKMGFFLSLEWLQITKSVLWNFALIWVIPFPKHPKNLDPSYKMDLNFWDCFEREIKVLQALHDAPPLR